MKSDCKPGATIKKTFSGIFIVDFDFCIQIAASYRLRLEESLITKKMILVRNKSNRSILTSLFSC